MNVRSLLEALDQRCPRETADSWDCVGLLVGDPDQEIQGVWVARDLTVDILRAAQSRGFGLILVHHPLLFPKKQVIASLLKGDLIYEAVRSGIAVAAYHTQFDRSSLEVVQAVSEGLGCVPQGRFTQGVSSFLLSVTLPEASVAKVRAALAQAGAGHLGDYSECSVQHSVVGTYVPQGGAQPFLGGDLGALKTVSEVCLRMQVPRPLRQRVEQALRASHPYEVPAFEWFPLNQPTGVTGCHAGVGMGFWGDFSSPLTACDFGDRVKACFQVPGFHFTGKPPEFVRRVGFSPGQGEAFLEEAAERGCDILVTGEVGYHAALAVARQGLCVLELGHPQSELFFIHTCVHWVRALGLPVEASFEAPRLWTDCLGIN